ncbi:MAG: S8 family serine peptidase [Elusimicrobia bacterium]|nr:S8 family serine peptidase [Elusimicrobiota bacterium]
MISPGFRALFSSRRFVRRPLLLAPLLVGTAGVFAGPAGPPPRRVIVQFQSDPARFFRAAKAPALTGLNAAFGVRSVTPVLRGGGATSPPRRAPARYGAARELRAQLENIRILAYDGPADPDEVARAFAAEPGVAWAEPDRRYEASWVPNDPDYSSLWAMPKIEAPTAWDSTAGGGVVVAVVDSGVDGTHPDLVDRMWANPGEIPANGLDDDGNGFVDDAGGWDFANDDGNPTDDAGHGTHVAGTIAATANNGLGVAGVAFGARLMPLKGLDAGGAGYESDLAAGIIYAADNGARIINASWGGSSKGALIEAAVNYARESGVLLVAAAGNSNGPVGYPAALDGVAAVAATDDADRKADFSSFGPPMDVAAPGVGILSTLPGGTYGTKSGTSMAAPHVSGVAALVAALHPFYTPAQLLAALRLAVDDVETPGFDAATGAGRINAARAASQRNLAAVNDPPTVSIVYPADGATVAGLQGLRGTAASSAGLFRVEVLVDGASRGMAHVNHGTWSCAVDATGLSGAHRLTVRALDVFDQSTDASVAVNVASPTPLGPGIPAVYDAGVGAPACGVGAECDSVNLLTGRGSFLGGAEPDAPNTLLTAPCADGNEGTFHLDESIDRLRVRSASGGPLTAGGGATIDVSYWSYFGFTTDRVALYYATSPAAPGWTPLLSFVPTAGGGQTLRTAMTLPDSPRLVLRAVMTYQIPPDACAAGDYTDHDDLLFDVAADTRPPVLSDLRIRPEPRRATLQWNTDEPSTAGVGVGPAGTSPIGRVVLADESLTHAAVLGDLTPDTAYDFQIASRDAGGRESVSSGTFRTVADTEPQKPRAFPSPYVPGAGDVRLIHLPAHKSVRIVSVSGHTVRVLPVDENGEARWDGAGEDGASVASGVYYILPEGAPPFPFVVQK